MNIFTSPSAQGIVMDCSLLDVGQKRWKPMDLWPKSAWESLLGNLEQFFLRKCLELTLPETNIIAPENWWLGDYFPFGFRSIFRDEPLGFRDLSWMTLRLSRLKSHIIYIYIWSLEDPSSMTAQDAWMPCYSDWQQRLLPNFPNADLTDQTPRKRLQQRQLLQDVLVLILEVHFFKAEFCRWIGSIKFPQDSKKLTACTGQILHPEFTRATWGVCLTIEYQFM